MDVDVERTIKAAVGVLTNRPEHYQSTDGIECIDVIRLISNRDEFRGFLKGNIIKYIWRYDDKGGVVDLEKAKTYLQWLIDDMEGLMESDYSDDTDQQNTY